MNHSPLGMFFFLRNDFVSRFQSFSLLDDRTIADPSLGREITWETIENDENICWAKKRRLICDGNWRHSLRVVLVIPTLGKCGWGRTLGGIWILIGFLVVAPSYNCKMRHLKCVGFFAAPFKCTCHAVAHVEVTRRDVRCQIQLSTKRFTIIPPFVN